MSAYPNIFSAEELIAKEISEFEKSAAIFAEKKKETLARYEREKSLYTSMVETPFLVQLHTLFSFIILKGESGFWVNKAWIEKWTTSNCPPGPIDNASILCVHGKSTPAKISQMKLVSSVHFPQASKV